MRKVGIQCTPRHETYIIPLLRHVLALQFSHQQGRLGEIRHEFVEAVRADQGMDS